MYEGKHQILAPTEFSKGLYHDNAKKIGAISKGNRIVSARQSRENVEKQMMDFAYVITRSENQRELRRSKR